MDGSATSLPHVSSDQVTQPAASPPGRTAAADAALSPALLQIIADTQHRRGLQHSSADVRSDYERALTSPTVEALIARHLSYLPAAEAGLLRRAYALAWVAHDGQRRQSGEPYIDHPVDVATILLDLRLDTESIASSLLHDVVEDSGVPLETVEQFFGGVVALLVDGVTKLSGLEDRSKEELQAGSYRKLIIATADDPRVVLIKLADRLHNMRTLGHTSPAKQARVARETLEIYAPLAHRLGMWQMKSELEDLAFKALQPERYAEIARGLSLRKEARERLIQRVIARLQEVLAREGIQAEITGRPKHIFSIWRKMERKGVPLERIYDQLAVRVIIDSSAAGPNESIGLCYRTLGVVHTMWTPVLSEFDDYIAVPKESSYQSIHTTVILPEGQHCEVQIRSSDMHELAEHGIAAHWRYKEGFTNRSDQNYDAKIRWLRELIAWRIELTDDKEFVDSLRSEFEEQVYVFTPRGKIIDLPEGSTPVDFAYRIHSEVGFHCIGARVNDRIVPLDYRLSNGEIVDIMTSKSSRGPSRDWLNFVKTAGARNHIRRFFRRVEREENIAAGREMLEKELKRHGLNLSFEQLIEVAGPTVRAQDDLFYQIGVDDLSARTLIQKVLAANEPPPPPPLPPVSPTEPARARVDAGGMVTLPGTGKILSRLARCCNPIVGEPIVGYVTRGRGVTVHRRECRTIVNEPDRARLMAVEWDAHSAPRQKFTVPLRIESWDRVGLWRDVSNIVADAGINIDRVTQGHSRTVGRVVINITVSLQSLSQLSQLIDKLNRIPDVIEARRETQGARR
jgi:GTP diphosphokinase / guanosine-3',5'-bis(diphosphate) 3'-diphosphatase